MSRDKLPPNREWTKRDERNDRGVTEAPITADEWNRGHKVDVVVDLHYRPGQRN